MNTCIIVAKKTNAKDIKLNTLRFISGKELRTSIEAYVKKHSFWLAR